MSSLLRERIAIFFQSLKKRCALKASGCCQTKAGVLQRVFERLQAGQIIVIKVEAAQMDGSSVNLGTDGTGVFLTGR